MKSGRESLNFYLILGDERLIEFKNSKYLQSHQGGADE
jgi:hypothetical protein